MREETRHEMAKMVYHVSRGEVSITLNGVVKKHAYGRHNCRWIRQHTLISNDIEDSLRHGHGVPVLVEVNWFNGL